MSHMQTFQPSIAQTCVGLPHPWLVHLLVGCQWWGREYIYFYPQCSTVDGSYKIYLRPHTDVLKKYTGGWKDALV